MEEKARSLQDVLYTCIQKGNWKGVIKKYEEEIEGCSRVRLTEAGETALHLAVYDNQEEVVEKLVQLICKLSQRNEVLRIQNERKNNPLHIAAAMGNAKMCYTIGSVDKLLVDERNIDGESPLFLAAIYGHKIAFYCLFDFCKMAPSRVRSNCRRNNGDTILNSLLKNENFDLAFQLINMNNESATWVDGEGFTPLHVLATKPSAFKSGANLDGLWQNIVYYCIYVNELRNLELKTSSRQCRKVRAAKQIKAASFPANYNTCIYFLTNLWKGFLMLFTPKGNLKKEIQERCNVDEELGVDEGIEINEPHESHPHLDTQLFLKPPLEPKASSSNFPENYDTCIDIFQLIFSAILIILGLGHAKYREAREKKKKHIWSVQVMEKLLELAPPNKYGQNGDTPMFTNQQLPDEELPDEETRPYTLGDSSPHFNKKNILHFDDQIQPNNNNDKGKVSAKETPMLIAAKNGVVEMVSRIFEHFPMAIRDNSKDKKNVVLLAAEFRQPNVYKFLLNKKTEFETLFRAVDSNGDSALHLAARLKTHRTWRITGAALQMQWEVKWYQLVKNSVEPHFFLQYNNKKELAKTIFNNTHSKLQEKGEEWLTNTSKSCSLLAVLVVTVAYASATTVPGGNGDTGTPPLIKEKGFFIFSLASLIALCLSTTSLIMFLAILTSRFDKKDFGSKLPRRLFIGLSSLFFSIVAMLVSFCAGHYFLLSNRLENTAVIIYIATSLPVALFFVLAQLTLYYDLLYAILSETPKRSNEVIVIDDPTL